MGSEYGGLLARLILKIPDRKGHFGGRRTAFEKRRCIQSFEKSGDGFSVRYWNIAKLRKQRAIEPLSMNGDLVFIGQ